MEEQRREKLTTIGDEFTIGGARDPEAEPDLPALEDEREMKEQEQESRFMIGILQDLLPEDEPQ